MIWYEHHIGDWVRKTVALTATEEGIYLRLIHWALTNECALPIPMAELRKLTRCRTRNDRESLQRVLERFWVLERDGWHNQRVDETVVKYRQAADKKLLAGRPSTTSKQRSRARMSVMFELLADKGVRTAVGMTARELEALCVQHIPGWDVTYVDQKMVTYRSRSNQEPDNQEEKRQETLPMTAAGSVCKAMKAAGTTDVNPMHPRLIALLEAGVTRDELVMAAAEATARGKGFAYALGIVEGRKREAADGPRSHQNGRESAQSDVVKAWAPALAKKTPTGPLNASDQDALPDPS